MAKQSNKHALDKMLESNAINEEEYRNFRHALETDDLSGLVNETPDNAPAHKKQSAKGIPVFFVTAMTCTALIGIAFLFFFLNHTVLAKFAEIIEGTQDLPNHVQGSINILHLARQPGVAVLVGCMALVNVVMALWALASRNRHLCAIITLINTFGAGILVVLAAVQFFSLYLAAALEMGNSF